MVIPAPPWQRPTRKRPVKPPLSRDAIVDAAMGILDGEGLDAVTMRRIAEELNTGPASLYAHVSNKDELHELMYDRVCGEMELPAPDGTNWREPAKQWMRNLHATLARHRDVARVSIAAIPMGPNVLRSGESLLAILRAGGVPDQAASWAMDLFLNYVTTAVYEGSLMADRGGWEHFQERISELNAYFRSLPPAEFPNTAALADTLTAGDGDARFEFGIEVIVAGLAAYAAGVVPPR